ncbi:TMEM14 family protein [Candidatus Bathyarchaeota archaeon]|nr:TMEM14 family protein [Candidatus Bathyarchaeota archaeon]
MISLTLRSALQAGLDTTAYILAALTASGGIAGYARTGSVISAVAGLSVGLLCECHPRHMAQVPRPNC